MGKTSTRTMWLIAAAVMALAAVMWFVGGNTGLGVAFAAIAVAFLGLSQSTGRASADGTRRT